VSSPSYPTPEMPLRLCWLRPDQSGDLPLPAYQSARASGMDVAAAVDGPVILAPGEISLLPTGFAVAIAPGYELQVRPRSGLAVKHGITVINSPGTIDADYRGEVRIGLINLGKAPYTIHRGDRIAQLVLAPVCRGVITVCRELDSTDRQDGGFGHTGRN
jgi:dUTP pyrophosphatase